MFLASSLEDLLEFSCVFPFDHSSIHSFLRNGYGIDWEVGNDAFGAAAGHPCLKAILKNCVQTQQHPEWAEAMMKSIARAFRSEFFVLVTTGPGLVSRTLAEYPGACVRCGYCSQRMSATRIVGFVSELMVFIFKSVAGASARDW